MICIHGVHALICMQDHGHACLCHCTFNMANGGDLHVVVMDLFGLMKSKVMFPIVMISESALKVPRAVLEKYQLLTLQLSFNSCVFPDFPFSLFGTHNCTRRTVDRCACSLLKSAHCQPPLLFTLQSTAILLMNSSF